MVLHVWTSQTDVFEIRSKFVKFPESFKHIIKTDEWEMEYDIMLCTNTTWITMYAYS